MKNLNKLLKIIKNKNNFKNILRQIFYKKYYKMC